MLRCMRSRLTRLRRVPCSTPVQARVGVLHKLVSEPWVRLTLGRLGSTCHLVGKGKIIAEMCFELFFL